MTIWIRYVLTLLVGVGIGLSLIYLSEDAPAIFVASTADPPPHANSAQAQREKVVQAHPQTQNPVTTLAEIMLISSDYAQTRALYNLGASASVTQLEKLIEEASGLSQVSERRAASSILYARFAELDSQAAVDYLLDHEGAYSSAWFSAIFHIWSRQNLDSAIEAAAKLELSSRSIAGTALLSARDDLSYDDRLEIAQRLGIEPVMQRLETRRQVGIADNDPQLAWHTAMATQNPQLKMQRMYGLAQVWGRSDPLAALNAASALSEADMSRVVKQIIMAQWGQRNSRDALEWVLTQSPSNRRAELLSTAIGGLASSEPRQAIAFADQLSGNERDAVLGTILTSWVSTDLRSALEWFDSEDGNFEQTAVSSVAMAYALQFPEEAFDWSISLSSDQSGSANQAVLSIIANNDPVLAAELTTRIVDRNLRINAARNLVQSWVESDPRAATQWIESFDDPDERVKLRTRLLSRWIRFDRASTIQYIEQMPAGMERDAASARIIRYLRDDFSAAKRLYDRIEAQEHRKNSARTLYHILRTTDPVRAEKYRSVSGIDE